jgi:RND family efflux transporter MFP subunit
MSQSDSRRRWRGLRIAGIVAAVVALVVVVHGVVTRAAEDSRLHDWTEAQSIPTVAVAPPLRGSNESHLELPGRLQAFTSAPIYARVAGYVKSWQYDIGTRVKAGDVLAVLETPDLDQQLAQARADLGTAKANADLAKVTSDRWQSILQSGAVSKQDADEKLGDYAAKLQMVKSAQANLDRLVATKDYAHIVAPFDGLVTARNTDIGALVNVGSSVGSELFVVSDTHKLRVYVNVPQSDVPSVPLGTKATMTTPDHPGNSYAATVEASASAVNAASGTTLMQFVVDNPAGDLLPGGYATVRLDTHNSASALSIPASALIFNASGTSVATVGAGNKVQIKPVTIARDLGKTIEIGSGLGAEDRVIENPSDGVANGAEVRIAGTEKPAKS